MRDVFNLFFVFDDVFVVFPAVVFPMYRFVIFDAGDDDGILGFPRIFLRPEARAWF